MDDEQLRKYAETDCVEGRRVADRLALTDELATLRARVAELEAWSADSHLKRELEAACEHAKAMEAERDQLAAVVEQVRDVVDGSVRHEAAYDLAADIRAVLPV